MTDDRSRELAGAVNQTSPMDTHEGLLAEIRSLRIDNARLRDEAFLRSTGTAQTPSKCPECGWSGGGVRDEGCVIAPCPRYTPTPPIQTHAQGSGRPAAFLAWAVEMFGPVAKLRSERMLRFIEEAIELAHAEGMERSTLAVMTERVYSRPRGDVHKEIGQAQACLETFAENIGLSSADEAQREWERVLGIPREEWTRRHSAKHAIGIALPSTNQSAPAPHAEVRAGVSALTTIAAECHRSKWKYADDKDKRPFDDLHRIGDEAMTLRDGLRALAPHSLERGEVKDPRPAGRDLGICLDCGVNDGEDHADHCSLSRPQRPGSEKTGEVQS